MKIHNLPEARFSYYFKSTSFSALFKTSIFVWDVLDNIPKYLYSKLNNINSANSLINKTAEIHPTAIIKNSIISSGCFIGEYAVVRDSLIAPNCTIGHCSEVARSIMLRESAITHFCFLGDSIIGNRVIVGGGVRTANRRLDKKNIIVHLRNKHINTNKISLGLIIGDESQVGGSVHSNPGTLIGRRVYVTPSIELKHFIPSFSFVKSIYSYEIIPNDNNRPTLNIEASLNDN